jgi:hypothetical protein
MYAFQWHFDIPFGTQKEVLDIARAWHDEMKNDKDVPKAIDGRLTVGAIGVSASHICDEHVYDSFEGFEQVMKVVATGKYKQYSDRLAEYIVPGSQHWIVLKIVA